MLWLLFAIISTLAYSAYHLLNKKIVRKTRPSYLANAIMIVFAALNIPFILIYSHEISINNMVVVGMLVSGFVFNLAIIYYMRALKEGEITETIPLLAVSPIFTLLIAFLLVGEMPGIMGIAGISLIIIGAYVLNIENFSSHHLLRPFTSLWHKPSSRHMLLVAFFLGLGGGLDKFIINSSNAITRILLMPYFVLLFQMPYLIIRDRHGYLTETKKAFFRKPWQLIGVSLVFLVNISAHVIAVSLTYAAYVIAIKRTSAFFAVVAAYFIYKEKKHFHSALLGTLLLIAGAVLFVV